MAGRPMRSSCVPIVGGAGFIEPPVPLELVLPLVLPLVLELVDIVPVDE